MLEKSTMQLLWRVSVVFITYLLLGSFIISNDLFDLAYLIIFYGFIITANIVDKKDKSVD